MNHAEKAKELLARLDKAYTDYSSRMDCELAYAAVRAAIDEMQADIDRVNKFADEMSIRLARSAHDLYLERLRYSEMLAELDALRAQVPELRGNVQRMDHILREKDAEIDRLRKDATRTLAAGGVLVRLGRSDDYADVCDELVFTDAMACCTWPAYELLVP